MRAIVNIGRLPKLEEHYTEEAEIYCYRQREKEEAPIKQVPLKALDMLFYLKRLKAKLGA